VQPSSSQQFPSVPHLALLRSEDALVVGFADDGTAEKSSETGADIVKSEELTLVVRILNSKENITIIIIGLILVLQTLSVTLTKVLQNQP
jgi:hypothetical protein